MTSRVYSRAIWTHIPSNVYMHTYFLGVILRMSLHNLCGCNMQNPVTLSKISEPVCMYMYSMCVQQVVKSNHVLRTSVSKHYISLQYISWCLQDAFASGTSAGIGMASWISHG